MKDFFWLQINMFDVISAVSHSCFQRSMMIVTSCAINGIIINGIAITFSLTGVYLIFPEKNKSR